MDIVKDIIIPLFVTFSGVYLTYLIAIMRFNNISKNIEKCLHEEVEHLSESLLTNFKIYYDYFENPIKRGYSQGKPFNTERMNDLTFKILDRRGLFINKEHMNLTRNLNPCIDNLYKIIKKIDDCIDVVIKNELHNAPECDPVISYEDGMKVIRNEKMSLQNKMELHITFHLSEVLAQLIDILIPLLQLSEGNIKHFKFITREPKAEIKAICDYAKIDFDIEFWGRVANRFPNHPFWEKFITSTEKNTN